MTSRSVRRYFGHKLSLRIVFYITTVISPVLLFFMYFNETDALAALPSSGAAMSSEEQQKQRQLNLNMGCGAMDTLKSNGSVEVLLKNREFLRNMIVNDDHKLMYCYIPKVSSTQWKKVMGVLSGRLPNLPLSEINGELVHNRRVHHFLSEFSVTESRKRLENYTSFLFVRHPLERLVSAYQDKFGTAADDAYFPRHFAAIIKANHSARNVAHGADAVGKRVEKRVTFEEFARWVSSPVPTFGARNEHWTPMVEQCHPCTVRYTVIGKMETLVADARYVLRTANVTTIVFPEEFHSKTTNIAGEMLASLPNDVLKRVIKLYLNDFLVFGYHPSEIFARNKTAKIFTRLLFENMTLASI